MKIFLATDHAGFELKEKVKEFLIHEGHDVTDCGALSFDKNDDYPDFISKAAKEVSKDPQNSKGIIFGGSGQGEAMVANKFKNIRCAVFYGSVLPIEAADASGRKSEDPLEMIKLTRKHNNTNILSFGARFVTINQACKAARLFLETPFPGEERHARRVEKIKKIEDGERGIETDVLK